MNFFGQASLWWLDFIYPRGSLSVSQSITAKLLLIRSRGKENSNNKSVHLLSILEGFFMFLGRVSLPGESSTLCLISRVSLLGGDSCPGWLQTCCVCVRFVPARDPEVTQRAAKPHCTTLVD